MVININHIFFSGKLETMTLEEKRKLYKDKNYVLLKDVKTWEDYFQNNKERLQKQCKQNLSHELQILSVNLFVLEIQKDISDCGLL